MALIPFQGGVASQRDITQWQSSCIDLRRRYRNPHWHQLEFVWTLQYSISHSDCKEVLLCYVMWIFTQAPFMGLNTMLWALSYPEIRRERLRFEVEDCVQVVQSGIGLSGREMAGGEAAMVLYDNLIEACLKAFESDKGEPYVISWPSGDTTPKKTSSGGTQSSSSPSTVTSSSAPFASESRPSPYTCYLEHTASKSRTYSSARSSFNASNSLELLDLVRT